MSLSFSLLTLGTPEDDARWDMFVHAHPESTPYHLCAWGKAVQASYGFKPEYWLALNGQEIVALCPTVNMRSLKAKKSICSLPYCDLGGILALDDESKLALREHILAHSAANGITSVELRESDSELTQASEAPAGQKVRMLLPLPENAEALMAQFKSKLRSQIRKAEKNGLSFKIIKGEDISLANTNDFYDIIAENMRLLGSPVHSKAWYQALIRAYGQHVYIALVYSDDIAIGAALVIKTTSKAVIPWASTRAKYNRLAPNMLLYWAVLSEATHQQLNEFDFGRSTVGEGTFNFKKQWGCLPQKLNWQSFENGSIKTAEHINMSSSRALIESVWQKLPLSVTNSIGPKVRKYISL
ncbi:GNAT family N-acetyltransferase [Glaciecola sp. SC05]|uniref:GNAT family N-acetyltransferase n=1 Tax=Glaciecola sp. SC05 TaxID=1987355 RepID=UPI003526D064